MRMIKFKKVTKKILKPYLKALILFKNNKWKIKFSNGNEKTNKDKNLQKRNFLEKKID